MDIIKKKCEGKEEQLFLTGSAAPSIKINSNIYGNKGTSVEAWPCLTLWDKDQNLIILKYNWVSPGVLFWKWVHETKSKS